MIKTCKISSNPKYQSEESRFVRDSLFQSTNMDIGNNNSANQPQQQTAENPSGAPLGNPFENNTPVDQEIHQSQEELEKEQQFKEAQTERD